LLLRPLGAIRAAAFLEAVYASSALTVEPVSGEDERRALEVLRAYADKLFSLADALIFAVSARLGVQHAFSFDHHFSQYGRLHVMSSPDAW
jgi:predicted nucleic acid-binding protein